MEMTANRFSPERHKAIEFLYAHLPQSDLDSYSPALFQEFADHALALRESAPWCAALSEEIFYGNFFRSLQFFIQDLK